MLRIPIEGKFPVLRHIRTDPAANSTVNLPGFWAFQIFGWIAFAFLSIFSLNVWYNPGELAPALHSFAQALIGIFISYPLRSVARRTWNTPQLQRIILNAIAILVASQIWTVLRLFTFTTMTNLPIASSDWGGWIFGSLTVFGSWAFCYHAIKYYRQWLEARELSINAQNAALAAEAVAERENARRLKAEGLAREAKLRMLNYQLNPHFLFNSLNSVSALVKRDDTHGAVEMIARISDYLRASLDDNETFHHQLRDEIEILELYLAIEKVRFSKRLNVVFTVSDAAADVEVPNLLLQPLIENTIKHAVGQSFSPTMIRINACVAGGRLNIDLSDDGSGASINTPDNTSKTATISRGIGLKNVAERLKSVYGDDYEFHAARGENSGFIVTISVPVKALSKRSDSPSEKQDLIYDSK